MIVSNAIKGWLKWRVPVMDNDRYGAELSPRDYKIIIFMERYCDG